MKSFRRCKTVQLHFSIPVRPVSRTAGLLLTCTESDAFGFKEIVQWPPNMDFAHVVECSIKGVLHDFGLTELLADCVLKSVDCDQTSSSEKTFESVTDELVRAISNISEIVDT
jgi:hypothetical protein